VDTTPRPRPARKSLVAERLARHRDPVSRLRARGLGTDIVLRRPPALELYYEPGDPHSHLCAQVLPALAERLRTRIDLRLVGESAPEDYPEPERQRAYALEDAIRIAPARGLRFPADAVIPTAGARTWAACVLAAASGPVELAARETDVAAALFSGQAPDRPGPGADIARTTALLESGAQRRRRLGHYLPAVWQLDGDWFWGVDRLDHLEARLRELKLLDGTEPLSKLRPAAAALPPLPPPLPPLEFFYSFRSPYSYLALLEMQKFHTQWPTGVQVRPVLPMAMRSITIPRAKRMYTLRDVKREADRLAVPFGRVADPLGEGARRCLQVFPHDASTEEQLDFLVSAARAVWAEGVDLADDAGLRYVCERAGISWESARERIAAPAATEYAEDNRRDLLLAGLWGVPCYRAGDFRAWGQDRFWMVRELLWRSGSV
jgi:2-hydroxychromene-2-carboxylate isomerase